MILRKETKGTYVFEPENTKEPAPISGLYIAKWFFESKPKSISIEIKEEE